MGTKMKILSIDAWREPEGGWTWNAWYRVGAVPVTEFEAIAGSPRKLFRWLRDTGMLSDASKGRVACEDDGYNVVIVNKSTREPLYAIEYGSDV